MSKVSQKMRDHAIDDSANDEDATSEPRQRAAVPFNARAASPFSWWTNSWTIARREFRSYFDSLVAYIVLGGGLLMLGVHFFLLQGQLGPSFFDADRANMQRMMEFMPKALIVFFALITMRSLAEEKRMGTLELLITLPVRDSEVIIGKYLGAMGLVMCLLLASMLYPLAMFAWPWNFGPLDWGPVWAAYCGLFFYSAAGIGVGMLFSSLTENQIVAFFLTLLVLATLYAIGYTVESLPGVLGDAFSFVSFQARYESFARGTIDTRAIVYFASIAVVCSLIAFRNLESRKWS